jgi:fructoselysine 6-kinase
MEKAVMVLLEKAVHQGCAIAVATRGPHEVILFDGSSWFRQAPKAVIPLDTLGAGDAFISGFLISYFEGNALTNVQTNSTIKKALEKAALFAAEICMLNGAFEHGLSY